MENLKEIELKLTRIYHKTGTNGQLTSASGLICHTIELPWLDNKPRLSCIPEGRYQVVQRYSQKFGFHLHILDVVGRSFILIHPANNAQTELAGCIAPVTSLSGHGLGSASVLARDRLHGFIVPPMQEGFKVYINIVSPKGIVPYKLF
jgi:hypothetical protein